MWRVSDDLWDVWEDVEAQFARLSRWAPHQRPGAWADADMLPVGRIAQRAERGSEQPSRLTLDEQRTMLTLWCVARSPLMLDRLPGPDVALAGAALSDAALPDDAKWHGSEAWNGHDAVIRPVMGRPALYVEVPPHGVHFYRLSRVRTS